MDIGRLIEQLKAGDDTAGPVLVTADLAVSALRNAVGLRGPSGSRPSQGGPSTLFVAVGVGSAQPFLSLDEVVEQEQLCEG